MIEQVALGIGSSIAVSLIAIAIQLTQIRRTLQSRQSQKLEIEAPASLHSDLTHIAWECGRNFAAGQRTG